MEAIVIASGGVDSITLAYLLRAEGYNLHFLSFDYGQRHKKEIAFAEYNAERLRSHFDRIDLSNMGRFLKSSVRADPLPALDGLGRKSTMTPKIIPNRNAIMLSIAYAIAVTEQAHIVAIGIHVGERYLYPDCRPGFIEAFDKMQQIAIEGFGTAKLVAPFLFLEKHQIVQLGSALQVPYEHTWSCYNGGEKHCGTCKACSERKRSFELAGIVDPTNYETELKIP